MTRRSVGDWVDLALYIFAALFIVLCVLVIKEEAQAAYAPTEQEAWSAPAIPDCDMELWLRIKDRCNE